MSFEKLEKLWNEFKDVPIDKDECIDEDFHIWEKGTDRYHIWHWFEYNFRGKSLSLHTDLVNWDYYDDNRTENIHCSRTRPDECRE